MKISSFFKKHSKEVILGVFIFLIVSLSFGLGYLSAKTDKNIPIIFETHSDR